MSVSRIYQQLKNVYHVSQAILWRVWHGFPERGLKFYGVTGTNGKTTTCILLGNILRAEYGKEKVGLLTTIVFWVGEKEIVNETKMTTMKSRDVFRFLRDMKRIRVTQVVFEMTSHALDQHRLLGIELEGAIITNIAREHLDYHHTMEEYAAAKAKIVSYIKPGGVLVGKGDDTWVRKILDAAEPTPTLISPSREGEKKEGVKVLRFTSEEARAVETPLIGDVNKENVLAATKLMRALSISEEAIRKGVKETTSVPGRMEWVEFDPSVSSELDYPPLRKGRKIRVLIDYAVTPDALERLYQYARTQTDGKIYGVLGAAGLRDRGKRPDMARVVAQYADELVITREDPWTEPEEQIFEDLEKGLQTHPNPPLSGRELPPDKGERGGFSWRRIPDRREALKYVLGKAQAGDIVVVTGKGAERGMGVGKDVIPWHERSVIEDAIKEL